MRTVAFLKMRLQHKDYLKKYRNVGKKEKKQKYQCLYIQESSLGGMIDGVNSCVGTFTVIFSCSVKSLSGDDVASLKMRMKFLGQL